MCSEYKNVENLFYLIVCSSMYYVDMNSLKTKRDGDGRVARDRSPRRAQARARRGCHVTGPGQLEL